MTMLVLSPQPSRSFRESPFVVPTLFLLPPSFTFLSIPFKRGFLSIISRLLYTFYFASHWLYPMLLLYSNDWLFFLFYLPSFPLCTFYTYGYISFFAFSAETSVTLLLFLCSLYFFPSFVVQREIGTNLLKMCFEFYLTTRNKQRFSSNEQSCVVVDAILTEAIDPGQNSKEDPGLTGCIPLCVWLPCWLAGRGEGRPRSKPLWFWWIAKRH